MTIRNILSVSGGKDSTAMWLWAIENKIDIDTVVFADTGHEHPITYGYLDYLESKLGPIRRVRADFSAQIEHKREVVQTKWRKEGVPESTIERALKVLHPTGNPFLDLCLWKGRFPSTKARFCTEFLKIKPIEEQIYMPILDAGDEINSLQAVRAEESPARALMDADEDVLGVTAIAYHITRPILRWTIDEVWAIHKRHGIMPNPLYLKGMKRVGCMPCVNTGKDEMFEIARRYPEEVERVYEWERIVSEASKRGASTFFALADKKGKNIYEVVEWSRTSRGGKQYDMFRQESIEPPICTSVYGHCE